MHNQNYSSTRRARRGFPFILASVLIGIGAQTAPAQFSPGPNPITGTVTSPQTYPIALVILAIPSVSLGGRLAAQRGREIPEKFFELSLSPRTPVI